MPDLVPLALPPLIQRVDLSGGLLNAPTPKSARVAASTAAALRPLFDSRMSSAELISVHIILECSCSGATLGRRYSATTICPVRPFCFKTAMHAMRGCTASPP